MPRIFPPVIGVKIGDHFGRWLVLGGPIYRRNSKSGKHTQRSWACECDCGHAGIVLHSNLRYGVSKSCGCLHKEIARDWHTGRKRDPETVAKMTATKLANPQVFTLEHRAKLRDARKRRPFSEKQSALTTALNKARVYKKGYKLKLSEDDVQRRRERITGEKNPSYNPDREHVAARYKLARWCVDTLKRFIKTNKTKHQPSAKILGYTKAELRKHIEAQFLPGMTWQNHGTWEIDHIYPVAAFLRDGITDPHIICALSNLRPLWKSDNQRKGDKIITPKP